MRQSLAPGTWRRKTAHWLNQHFSVNINNVKLHQIIWIKQLWTKFKAFLKILYNSYDIVCFQHWLIIQNVPNKYHCSLNIANTCPFINTDKQMHKDQTEKWQKSDAFIQLNTSRLDKKQQKNVYDNLGYFLLCFYLLSLVRYLTLNLHLKVTRNVQ